MLIGIVTHPVGVAVTKVDGAYNIVDNTISIQHLEVQFQLLKNNPPDERDWTGITTFSKSKEHLSKIS